MNNNTIITSQRERELSIRAIVIGLLIGLLLMAMMMYLDGVLGLDTDVAPIASTIGIFLIPLFGGKTNRKEVNIMQTTATAVTFSAYSLTGNYIPMLMLGAEYRLLPAIIVLLLSNGIGICFVSLLRNQFVYDESLPFPSAVMCKTAIDQVDDVKSTSAKILLIAMDALVDLMNRTDKVSIKGPDTDLTFSIKDIPAIKCDGKMNIPDGEVYTAPIRDSVNGVISYNVKSENQGFTYENISFEVKNGKITSAKANNTERINALLDTDEGARYFGEFAIGVNPFVTEPMNDILFDEKICGSFHLTPGMAYDDADNGNRSSVHWDLVMIQRPEYGGGEIWFDDLLIRKDGQFVLAELECLNPEILSK